MTERDELLRSVGCVVPHGALAALVGDHAARIEAVQVCERQALDLAGGRDGRVARVDARVVDVVAVEGDGARCGRVAELLGRETLLLHVGAPQGIVDVLHVDGTRPAAILEHGTKELRRAALADHVGGDKGVGDVGHAVANLARALDIGCVAGQALECSGDARVVVGAVLAQERPVCTGRCRSVDPHREVDALHRVKRGGACVAKDVGDAPRDDEERDRDGKGGDRHTALGGAPREVAVGHETGHAKEPGGKTARAGGEFVGRLDFGAAGGTGELAASTAGEAHVLRLADGVHGRDVARAASGEPGAHEERHQGEGH